MEHDFALKTKAKNQSKTKINTSESRCNTYVRKEYMANELGWEYGNQSVLHLCRVVVPLTLQFRDALHPVANNQRIGRDNNTWTSASGDCLFCALQMNTLHYALHYIYVLGRRSSTDVGLQSTKYSWCRTNNHSYWLDFVQTAAWCRDFLLCDCI